MRKIHTGLVLHQVRRHVVTTCVCRDGINVWRAVRQGRRGTICCITADPGALLIQD